MTFLFSGMAVSEVRAARAIGGRAGVEEHRFVRLPDLKESQDMGVGFRGLPPTYIPMRNAIFYSLAASYAEETGARCIVGGHNKDDLGVFRDAGPPFFRKLEGALWAGSKILKENRTRILRPLESKTKPQVVKLANSLGVPLELTWSCHSDGERHCWACEGCRNRTKAFRSAGVADPLRE